MYSKEELKNLKTEFWESFAAFCDVQPFLYHRKKMWMLYDTKVKCVELKFDVTRKGAKVMLEISHRDDIARLEMYERIALHKVTLEEGFNGQLIWDEFAETEHSKPVSRIYVEKNELDFHRRSHWGELFRFMADNMFLLENNFIEIKDYLAD